MSLWLGHKRVKLRWHNRRRKVYIYLRGRTVHFGRLNGRWSYGIDRPDPEKVWLL